MTARPDNTAYLRRCRERRDEVMELCDAWRAAGWSREMMCEELARRGMRTARGKAWTPMDISRLRHKFFRGLAALSPEM